MPTPRAPAFATRLRCETQRIAETGGPAAQGTLRRTIGEGRAQGAFRFRFLAPHIGCRSLERARESSARRLRLLAPAKRADTVADTDRPRTVGAGCC